MFHEYSMISSVGLHDTNWTTIVCHNLAQLGAFRCEAAPVYRTCAM
jgi:hypothetical protein